jgi:histidine ammonia-lyase
MKKFQIANKNLTEKVIDQIIDNHWHLELSEESVNNIEKCRQFLDKKMIETATPIYGITTGFGSLRNVSISSENLSELQHNLVKSHACGMGEEVCTGIVQRMLILKIHSLSKGNSGICLATVQGLVDMYNNGYYPVVYQQGSLGASGDLAPLAHLSLPLIGEGEVFSVQNNAKISAKEMYKQLNSNAKSGNKNLIYIPLNLHSKEGLALLNGTQFMSSHAVYCLSKAKKLSYFADLIAAVSLDAYDGIIAPFNPLIQEIRNYNGQKITAENFRKILEGSQIIAQNKQDVQDPYSFRCIPQVHGAVKDLLNYYEQIVLNEINAVTDNPTIFPDDELIISAGNFHGEPIAMAMDFLAIALSELGSISERRTYKLISGNRGLPSFLVANPGLNSGFMIVQYSAASIVSQNKQLSTPACIDTIDSSQGQEDHVSMGANAATKLVRVLENVEKLLAIELMTAMQALDFRKNLTSSPIIENFRNEYRKNVHFIENDEFMHPLMQKSLDFLKNMIISE